MPRYRLHFTATASTTVEVETDATDPDEILEATFRANASAG